MSDPTERQYDPDRLVRLCREYDGLRTQELAERMDARRNTTHYRCTVLEKEGRLESMIYGRGHAARVWYAVDG
jgi:predicted ArsR family transcriptional regulator